MKRRKSRNFSIASAGRDLFNGVYYELNPDSFTTSTKGICFRGLLYNLFTTDYDNLLEENSLHLKRSSYALLACLKNDIVPKYVNNSILNIVLDVVYQPGKMRKKNEMKKTNI